MPVPIIAVRQLTKTYGRDPVVAELSFDVQAGMVTAFLGPNGAGKTTTIRVILGLAHPTRGEATVLGQPFTALAHPMNQVGVLIDGSGFHPSDRPGATCGCSPPRVGSVPHASTMF